MVAARTLIYLFTELKTGATRGKLWGRRYFAATVGNVSADKRYVEEQWGK